MVWKWDGEIGLIGERSYVYYVGEAAGTGTRYSTGFRMFRRRIFLAGGLGARNICIIWGFEHPGV